MKKFSAAFMIVIGLMVIALWIMLISTNQVPELETEFWSISTHITAEILMAFLLIAGGISMLKQSKKSMVLVPLSLGTLLYSIINSSGYYLEKGEYPFVILFAVLLLFTLTVLYQMFKSPDSWFNR